MLLLALAGSAIQLVPDGTLLLHLALIAVMVGVLNVTLLKPINRILEDRERRTKGRVEEAHRIFAGVTDKLQEYEARLREARAEGYLLLEAQRAAVSKERERKVAEIKVEVASWLESEKERLRLDAEQIRKRLKQDARTVAQEIAGRILRREVSQLPDES
ncbi:MAG TPA: ATP synthase F0 subunit B [Pyrinomonadaceae bacterium]